MFCEPYTSVQGKICSLQRNTCETYFTTRNNTQDLKKYVGMVHIRTCSSKSLEYGWASLCYPLFLSVLTLMFEY
jgi:hypothetical protein